MHEFPMETRSFESKEIQIPTWCACTAKYLSPRANGGEKKWTGFAADTRVYLEQSNSRLQGPTKTSTKQMHNHELKGARFARTYTHTHKHKTKRQAATPTAPGLNHPVDRNSLPIGHVASSSPVEIKHREKRRYPRCSNTATVAPVAGQAGFHSTSVRPEPAV